MLLDVTAKFNTCIDELAENKDMVRFIKDHERRPVVLENLSKEILNYEKNFMHGKQTRRHVNEMIASTAQMFYEMAKLHREQHNLSRAEQDRMTQDEGIKKELLEICPGIDEVVDYGSPKKAD